MAPRRRRGVRVWALSLGCAAVLTLAMPARAQGWVRPLIITENAITSDSEEDDGSSNSNDDYSPSNITDSFDDDDDYSPSNSYDYSNITGSIDADSSSGSSTNDTLLLILAGGRYSHNAGWLPRPTPSTSDNTLSPTDPGQWLSDTVNFGAGGRGDDSKKPNNGQPTPAPTRDPNAPVYSAGWSSIEITNELIRRALTSVRYAANYEKYMKTRVCLNRINGIKARTVNDVDSYLYNVDGCELSDVTSNGRCDPYSCRLYTYEVKVSQKTVGSDAYVVQSIFKSLTQKSLAELMRMGNLDITGDSGSGESDPQSQPALFLLSEGMELPPPDVPRRIHTSASIPNLALLALVATMVSSAVAVVAVLRRVRRVRLRRQYPPLKTTIASLDLPV